MQPSEPTRHTITEQRAIVYKLLSDCYQSPDEYTMEKFQQAAELAADIFPEINLPEYPNGQSEDIETRKVDHARLFVGPFSLLAPPYGSMYLDHTEHLMTDSTEDVQNRYREEGMDVAITEVPDHIRIELEFVYYLIFREMQIVTPNQESAGALDLTRTGMDYRIKQQKFLNDHLVRWIPKFEAKVREHAKTEFYKQLAALTKIFILHDLNLLREESIVM